MKLINAENLDHKDLNEKIRLANDDVEISSCMGQRFVAAGLSKNTVKINGVPGNALGAYLDGALIEVAGNAQDAVGDTMNSGKIVVHGNIGDAVGYAMRGGEIYVKGNAGYRAGIHMKEYKEKLPVMVIGGKAGSFLGEYQAGGIIIVLGISNDEKPIVGNFPCTGMHGGKMYLKSSCENLNLPDRVTAKKADSEDMEVIKKYLEEFCERFDYDFASLYNCEYTVVTPDSKNPYKQMYVAN